MRKTTAAALFSDETFFGDRPVPMTLADGTDEARWIIGRAIAEEGPIVRAFLLISGGNDSMVVLDSCSWAADEIVHINTGIGVPETNAFVRAVVADRGWPLTELHPLVPYDDLVLGRWQGFPGPAGHRFAYQRLKERPLRQLIRDHRTRNGQRFMLLTGIRNDESQRRMGYGSPVGRHGGQVWVNPLLRWSNELMREYRTTAALPVNEVTTHLHMSGECLCGAFARPGELDEIKFFYPHVAERIAILEAKAEAIGLRNCRWGERPAGSRPAPGPMCSSCTLFDTEAS